MGFEKLGTNLAQKFICKTSVLPSQHINPIKTQSLHYTKNLTSDTFQFTENIKNKLVKVLSSEHCPLPDYMARIPKGASEKETVKLLEQMFEDSKFFSRVSTCEKSYGKNFAFAELASNLFKQSTKLISEEKSFDEVLEYIAKGYSKESQINNTLTKRIGKSGIYRGSHTYTPKYIDEERIDMFVTGYGCNGAKDGYIAYVDRLNSNLDNRVSPYEKFTLTKRFGSDSIMQHPYNEEVAQNMDIISEKYKTFQKLVNEYKKTGKLTTHQKAQADDIISEIYYLMANTCPFKRGSNGISDILMRSQYSALGINMPHVKKGVGLDLEAFCFELNDYKKNWQAFFEGGGEIKPVTYQSKKIMGLLPVFESLRQTVDEYVQNGLIREEFRFKVENVTSIDECKKLQKLAKTKMESLYASLRIPKQLK